MMPGIALESQRDALIIRSDKRLMTIASAIVGGGVSEQDTFLLRHVDKSYDEREPVNEFKSYAASVGIQGGFVGLMTAAWLKNLQSTSASTADITVDLFLTAAVGNATAAGISLPCEIRVGTINIIAFTNAALSPGALVNAVITMTEAKTAVLRDSGITAPDNAPATGTSTDAIVVATDPDGPRNDYAGPLTDAGYLLASCVRHCLGEALNAS